MLDEKSVGELCALVLKVDGLTFVLDAAAFTTLRDLELSPRQLRMVGTPHFGEMAKFLKRDRNDVEKDALGSAREYPPHEQPQYQQQRNQDGGSESRDRFPQRCGRLACSLPLL